MTKVTNGDSGSPSAIHTRAGDNGRKFYQSIPLLSTHIRKYGNVFRWKPSLTVGAQTGAATVAERFPDTLVYF